MPTHTGWEKRTHIFSYWVYNKSSIWTSPYIKASDGKIFYFGTTKAMFVPTNRNLVADILPHISSALRYLSVNFEKYVLFSSPKLVYIDPAGTLDS